MVSRSCRHVKFPSCRIISILAFTGSNGDSNGDSFQESPLPVPVVFHHRVLAPLGR